MKALNPFKILASIVAILLLSNCENKEESEEIFLGGAPTCEITLSDDSGVFEYGDTITINAAALENAEYVSQMKLYLNGQLIFNTTLNKFSHSIKTTTKVAGEYSLELLATGESDSTGTASSQFTIVAAKPAVKTGDLEYGADSALVAGQFLSDGGTDATWGLCYNTTGSPTKEENTYTTTATNFSLKLQDLDVLTIYYIRAWASNEMGTVYGDEVQFKTTDETGTFRDIRDEKEYGWVKIGEQVWMSENLAYLPFLTDPYLYSMIDSSVYVHGYWGTDIKEAIETESYNTYGALYSWKMANQCCPSGWHLPNTAEFEELADFLGGKEIAGGKLKERGYTYWDAPNEGATNEVGFNGYGAAGFLPYHELFTDLHTLGVFWYNYTKGDNIQEGDCQLGYSAINLVISDGFPGFRGYSVRCIKD